MKPEIGRTKKQRKAASRQAHSRYLRRCQLWYAHKLLCRDYEEFRDGIRRIEAAIAAQLKIEFPDFPEARGRS